MEGLKDIKGIVEVPDSSFLYLLLTIVMVFVLLVGFFILLQWFLKPKRKRRRATEKELALLALKEINFDDTKEAVYTFSEKIPIVLKENSELEHFIEGLEMYKFKKEVPTLSSEKIEKMKRFIKESADG